MNFNEYYLNESWFHGTPDSREIDKNGFVEKIGNVDYISDLDGYQNLQNKLSTLNNTDEEYFDVLNKIPKYKKQFKYKKPIFFTDKYKVAKTYADDMRALDYQNATPKVCTVDVTGNKILTIDGHGSRFRFINEDYVKDGLIDSGIDKTEAEKVIRMFNYYTDKGITTDLIAAIAYYFKFDIVDVKNVLDSYHGGNIKSTVRMVFDPNNINIKG
jgi:hypothetical protein